MLKEAFCIARLHEMFVYRSIIPCIEIIILSQPRPIVASGHKVLREVPKGTFSDRLPELRFDGPSDSFLRGASSYHEVLNARTACAT